MSVISYTLHKCTKCMRCLRTCPTEAITIQEGRAIISPKKCINCGLCMSSCKNLGLQAKGSTLVDKDNYDYSVILVPTSIYSDCTSMSEVETLQAAISKLGFDEVVNLSEFEGAVYDKAKKYIEKDSSKLFISSFCPVVNQLIEKKYPMLLPNLIPFDYPAEICAKDVRNKYKNEDKTIGIFLLCECPSKLSLAKYPYGRSHSSIDHALSIVDVFPQINHLRGDEKIQVELCGDGIKASVSGLEVQIDNKIIFIDGLDKIQKVLELAEFGLLKDIRLLSLSACVNGCIGGKFIWGNSFNGKINMHELLKSAKLPNKELSLCELYSEETAEHIEASPNIFLQLRKFKAVNEKLDELPGFDCGACGFPSCRTMAEEIVEGNKSLKDCKILGKRENNESK